MYDIVRLHHVPLYLFTNCLIVCRMNNPSRLNKGAKLNAQLHNSGLENYSPYIAIKLYFACY